MVMITGYEEMTKLYESTRSIVYRARRSHDQRSVILKVMQAQYPSLEELNRYRLEYEILKRLNLHGVAQAYGLENYQNGLMLVLEDVGGTSLRQIMQQQRPEMVDFLRVAIALTDILSRVHAANVIHKDINPANILLTAQLHQVVLIDFGNATMLSRENPTFRSPNVLEGTLPYLSPEQTGRMNRALDYRTDFYSLGATFYEMLTGQPPFTTTDPMELIHCHLAKKPEPPEQVNPAIPPTVSQIVLKLLAKNAEDRYQSSYGIKADLQICLEQWQTGGTIAPFPLAQRDASGQFQIPQKFYGREQEVAALLAAFERVAGGSGAAIAGSTSLRQRSELMLVTGYSGIGKSSLVYEIYKPITERQGYFIAGKFDQFQRNIPYLALIQSFKDLMRQLLTETPEQIQRWQSVLHQALGMNGAIVAEVIPEVELIMGEQPPVPNLPSRETQNRFNLVFQKFVQVFTQADHPLVMFLDDLQWADAASLQLLEMLISAPDSRYLFLVGAYRSNEVSAVHPLMVTVEAVRRAGVHTTQIDLPPLQLAAVCQMVADTCHCTPTEAEPLAQFIHRTTEGNPFFISEFLKSLYTEGLLNFEETSGQWRWDLSQIEATYIPEDVVALTMGKIQKLSSAAQNVLQFASCMGGQFDASEVAIAANTPLATVTHVLWQAVQAGLIVPLGSNFSLAAIESDQESNSTDIHLSFKFLHDRVQQAAYSLIDTNELQHIHYLIGRSLLASIPPDQEDDRLFDIVNQLSIGRDFITDPGDRLKLSRLCLKAGEKASESTAYDAALRYLETGLSLLNADRWQSQYDLTLKLHETAAEAAYLNGDFEQSDRLVNEILNQACNILDAVKAYQVRMFAYTAQNNMDKALDTFVVAAQQLGMPVPRHPSRIRVGLELLRTRYFIVGNRPLSQLEFLPSMSDPYKLGLLKLASSVIIAAANSAPYFVAVLGLRVVNMVVKFGSSPMSAVQGIAYGVMLRTGLQETERSYEFGRMSLRQLDRVNTRQYRTITIVGFESCLRHWKEPLRHTLPPLLAAYTEGLDLGNLEAASLAASVYCFHQFFLGEPLNKVAADFEQYEKLIFQFRQENTAYSMLPFHQLVLNLQGLATEPDRLKGTAFDEDKLLPFFIDSRLGVPSFYTYICRLIWFYHIGNYAKAVQSAKQAAQLQENSPVTTPYANLSFYWSLSCLAHYSNASKSVQRQYLQRVKTNQRMTIQWTKHCPENYQHRYDLVQAEYFRVLGQYDKATDAYDRAIEGAKDHDYINELALASELAGKFRLSIGRDRVARLYLTDARYYYLRWGATFKVDTLTDRYSDLLQRSSESINTDPNVTQIISTGSPHSSGAPLNLDLETVVKAAQAVSSEIVLDRLLAKLMALVLENAGAQQGCLLLTHQHELRIEAIGAIGQQEVVQVATRALNADYALPLSLIYYVQRTQEAVVLGDATHEGLFTTDPYMQSMRPQSVICSPILNQGQLIGIVYLENSLTPDAFTAERVTVLNILSAQAAIALENARFYRTLEDKVEERTAQLAQSNAEIRLLNQRLQSENLRMSAELAITRQIQQLILPKEQELSQIPDLEIAGYMEPAEEVGGDYYDVLYQDGSVKIGIGDVTGHGLESGMLMLMVQTAIRTLLESQEKDAARFLNILNRVVYHNTQRMNCDKTLTLALLDYSAGTLRLSGQHEEVLLVRANGEIESIDTMNLGLPIGLVEEIAEFVAHLEVQLAPGDGIVLYTDGIIEAINPQDEFYGLERLKQIVSENWSRSCHDVQQAVIDDLRSHIDEQKVFDDITLLVIKQR